MQRCFSVRSLLLLVTACSVIIAVVISFLPGRSINLHSDRLTELSDGTTEDNASWTEYLGRTHYTQEAWNGVTRANQLWGRKRYRSAIEEWWRVAAKYRDTEAALAALENAANAETDLGNELAAVHAWEMVLLLPEVQHKDAGINLMNYRHNACMALTDYYYSISELAYSQRFLNQAIEQDYLQDTCGTFSAGYDHDLRIRLAAIRNGQEK